MSDLYNKNGELLISPGELLDRITILELKLASKKCDKAVIEDYKRAVELLTNLDAYEQKDVYVLRKLVRELKEINSDQWDLEDRVRTEKSWEAAFAARENNTKRVAKKNEINILFNYPCEMKDYKTS